VSRASSPVRKAFAANFAERGEIGASVAVVAGGRPVMPL
jgi:predicted methyltransferase MtxX (methanogen marker protein 4)